MLSMLGHTKSDQSCRKGYSVMVKVDPDMNKWLATGPAWRGLFQKMKQKTGSTRIPTHLLTAYHLQDDNITERSDRVTAWMFEQKSGVDWAAKGRLA
jgi:hypothetical protein